MINSYPCGKLYMNKKILVLYLASLILILPVVVAAGGVEIPDTPRGDLNITTLINGIFGIIWPFFAALAIFAYLLAGFLFLTSKGNPQKVDEARAAVVWGSVGIAVGILSLSIPWVIKNLLGV